MTGAHRLGVVEAAAAIRNGEITATALVEACLDRIAAADARLQAWAAVDGERARTAAAELDGETRRGASRGPLHGVPIGIKDIIDVAGLTTTAGAPPFAHTQPTIDATLVSRLREAGAVILGKTVATAFAYKDPAPTRNPWRDDRTPGGSSSGSAAAVAARQVPVAIGTQTLGSILRPSAFCGAVGLKGDHGSVPLDGVVPLAVSLDTGGPIARSVADVAVVQAVLEGREPVGAHPAAPTIGVAESLLARAEQPLRTALDSTLEGLAANGARLESVELPPGFEELLAAGFIVFEAEAADAHRERFAAHGAEYPPVIAGLVTAGLARSAREIEAARRTVAASRVEIEPLLDALDVLVSPTATNAAPLRSVGTGDPGLCAPWTYLGTPAITLPIGLDADGMPLAVQLVAGGGRLGRLLDAAAWVEAELAFEARPPVD